MKCFNLIGLHLRRLIAVVCGLGFSFNANAVELTLWEHEYLEIQAVLDKVIADFEKSYAGIKINRAHYKTEDLRAQFQTAALGGGGADIVFAPNDFAGPFSIMGVISAVNDWADTGRFDEITLKAVTDDKGQVWGLPVSSGNHLILFANKDYVKKAPETLEELVKLAKEFTDPGKKRYGLVYNLNEPFWFAAFMAAYGEHPLKGGQPHLGGEAMVHALTLVKSLKFADKVVPADCDYACAQTLFLEGKAAMTINGDWAAEKFKEGLGDKLIVAPLPKLAATGSYMAPMVSGKYLFFNSRMSKKKAEAARKFGNYLTSEKVQEHLAKATGRLPALKSMAKSDVVEKDPLLKAIKEAMVHGQPMPMDVKMRIVWDAMRPQLQAVMAGRTEPKMAAKIMQQDAQNKIKQMTR